MSDRLIRGPLGLIETNWPLYAILIVTAGVVLSWMLGY